MTRHVLNVGFPFAPVGPDAVGGAEQVLSALDHALVRAGHRSLVVAAEGSIVAGTLISVPRVTGPIDERARESVYGASREAIRFAFDRWRIDLVHVHGVDFPAYLPPQDVPVIVTVHLWPSCFPAGAFTRRYLVPVSNAERRAWPHLPWLPAIENGIPVDRYSAAFRASRRRSGFALALGRICPEKGFHVALDAARSAGVPILLAGRVFPYADHEDYFRNQIAPRLDRHARFVGPLGFARKRRVLSAARCLLVPSLTMETSSLVAMEALASGTPVIAFPAGALADIVEHGRTGFLVHDVAEMADAMRRVDEIDPAACVASARRRFSADEMVRRYLSLYERVIDQPVLSLQTAAR
jgi:glycosyltransferase involved in cell wall biosynthesis